MGVRQAFSGFRAFSTEDQGVVGGSVFPVKFQDNFTAPFGFDLMDEYDPNFSTFTANQDGVYSIMASVFFFPDQTQNPTDYSATINIVLNNTTTVSTDIEDVPSSLFDHTIVISTSTILQLNDGDALKVEFSAFNSTGINGTIFRAPSSTHFEAARFPSP